MLHVEDASRFVALDRLQIERVAVRRPGEARDVALEFAAVDVDDGLRRRKGDVKREACGAPASIYRSSALGRPAKIKVATVSLFGTMGALSGFTCNEDLRSSLPLAMEIRNIAKKEETCDERSALAFAPYWHSFSA